MYILKHIYIIPTTHTTLDVFSIPALSQFSPGSEELEHRHSIPSTPLQDSSLHGLTVTPPSQK